MISNTTRSSNPAGHAGLLENLLALTSALTAFLESRFALFAQESKAALMPLFVLAACSILALVSSVQTQDVIGHARFDRWHKAQD